MTAPTMAPPNGRVPSLLGKATALRIPTARRRTTAAAWRRAWLRVQPVSLSVAGVGCLAGAAWTVGLWAGLLATGAGLLVLEWRLTN